MSLTPRGFCRPGLKTLCVLQVRVDAVVALRSFIDAFDTEGLQQVKPLIPQLLDVFFQLMQEVLLCSAPNVALLPSAQQDNQLLQIQPHLTDTCLLHLQQRIEHLFVLHSLCARLCPSGLSYVPSWLRLGA